MKARVVCFLFIIMNLFLFTACSNKEVIRSEEVDKITLEV